MFANMYHVIFSFLLKEIGNLTIPPGMYQTRFNGRGMSLLCGGGIVFM